MSMTETHASAWKTWHSISLSLLLAVILGLEVFLPTPLRMFAWLSVFVLLAVFVLIVGQGITGRWLGALIDFTYKMSLSRLQVLLWTFLILSSLLTAVATNINAGVSDPLAIAIPTPLWLLMGISTASMVGSPLLQTLQQRRSASIEAKQQALTSSGQQSLDLTSLHFSGQSMSNQSVEAANIMDIFAGSDAGREGIVNIGYVQMFFFTVILLFAYGTALASMFSTGSSINALPSMDAGMVALLGISHAGFLVNQVMPTST